MKRKAITLITLLLMAFALIVPAAAFAQGDNDESMKDSANQDESKGGTENESGGDSKKDAAEPKHEDAGEGEAKKETTEKPVQSPPTHHRIPPEAIEHYNRGVELHKGGFLNKAILEYKEAIKADDQMERAYSNIGLIYTSQKSWTKAMEAFDKALKMKPDRTTSLNGLGTVLYALKRVDEAMDKWRKAVEIDPNFASAYYNMGNAYETEGKSKDALDCYVKALRVNPNMGDAYYRIGTLLNKTKHEAQAFVLLDKAVKVEPDAEFVRDARKQLSSLDVTLKENGEQGPAAEPDKKAFTPPGKKGKTSKRIPFRFKPKVSPQQTAGKNVDMFVQPPSGDGSAKADNK